MIPLSFKRRRFPPTVIRHAVWLHARFTLSYRDIEEMLVERGVDVSYETIRGWFLKFGPAIAATLRRLRPRPSHSVISEVSQRHGAGCPLEQLHRLARPGDHVQVERLYRHIGQAPAAHVIVEGQPELLLVDLSGPCLVDPSNVVGIDIAVVIDVSQLVTELAQQAQQDAAVGNAVGVVLVVDQPTLVTEHHVDRPLGEGAHGKPPSSISFTPAQTSSAAIATASSI